MFPWQWDRLPSLVIIGRNFSIITSSTEKCNNIMQFFFPFCWHSWNKICRTDYTTHIQPKYPTLHKLCNETKYVHDHMNAQRKPTFAFSINICITYRRGYCFKRIQSVRNVKNAWQTVISKLWVTGVLCRKFYHQWSTGRMANCNQRICSWSHFCKHMYDQVTKKPKRKRYINHVCVLFLKVWWFKF